jgi:hypothetical protein
MIQLLRMWMFTLLRLLILFVHGFGPDLAIEKITKNRKNKEINALNS